MLVVCICHFFLVLIGTLAKPFNGSSGGGIDLVFATYWFFPAKTQGILPKDRDCIQEKMSMESQRFEENSKSLSRFRIKCL